MAGHSQFSNIMHRKGAQDKKRAKVFAKLIREVTVAAKTGMPDPDANPRLRSAIVACRAANMPKENISINAWILFASYPHATAPAPAESQNQIKKDHLNELSSLKASLAGKTHSRTPLSQKATNPAPAALVMEEVTTNRK